MQIALNACLLHISSRLDSYFYYKYLRRLFNAIHEPTSSSCPPPSVNTSCSRSHIRRHWIGYSHTHTQVKAKLLIEQVRIILKLFCRVYRLVTRSLETEYWVKLYGAITNDVSDYIHLLVRIAHIICNHHIYIYIHSINITWTITQQPHRKNENCVKQFS
jgi:hypothetical protein